MLKTYLILNLKKFEYTGLLSVHKKSTWPPYLPRKKYSRKNNAWVYRIVNKLRPQLETSMGVET